MIGKIRRILGLETDDEKLARFNETNNSIAELSRKIDNIAEEFTIKNESFKSLLKSGSLDQQVKQNIQKRYDNFLNYHKQELQPIVKQRRELRKQHEAFMKDSSLFKAIRDINIIGTAKEKYLSGDINQNQFDIIIKARQGKVKYSDIILFNEEGRFLILQRSNEEADKLANMWGVPGGHVDAGEEFYDAAVRELWEESGITCKELEEIGIYEDQNVEIHYFIGNVSSKEIMTAIQAGEAQDLKWIHVENIPDYKMPFNMAENLVKLIKQDSGVGYWKKLETAVKQGKIEKSFYDELFLKARSGIYKDTPENRKKGIVGQKYGTVANENEEEKEEKYKDFAWKRDEKLRISLLDHYSKGRWIRAGATAAGMKYLRMGAITLRLADHSAKETLQDKNQVSIVVNEFDPTKQKFISDNTSIFKVSKKVAISRIDNLLKGKLLEYSKEPVNDIDDFEKYLETMEAINDNTNIKEKELKIVADILSEKSLKIKEEDKEKFDELIEEYGHLLPDDFSMKNIEIEKNKEEVKEELKEISFSDIKTGNKIKTGNFLIEIENKSETNLKVTIKKKNSYLSEDYEIKDSIDQDVNDWLNNRYGKINPLASYFNEKVLRRFNINKIFNSDIVKSLDIKNNIKALETGKLQFDLIKAQVHKYIRREGSKGNYKYIYEEPKQETLKGEEMPEILESKLEEIKGNLIKYKDDTELGSKVKEVLSKLNDGEIKEAIVKFRESELHYQLGNTYDSLKRFYADLDIHNKYGLDWGTIPGKYEVWRSGEVGGQKNGIFFSIDKSGAEAYGDNNSEGRSVNKYEVNIQNPLVVKRAEYAYSILSGKSMQSILSERDKSKDVGNWWINLDKKVAKLAKGRGYDSITYTAPAPPAIRELVLLDPSSVTKKDDDVKKSLDLLESAYEQGLISFEILEKARTGKYADTAENRKLKRVGKEYGSKKQEEQTVDKQKKDEETKIDKPASIEDQAKQASQTALENAAKGGNEELRVAAHKELQRREQEEKPKEGKEEDNKGTESNPIDEVNSKIEEELNKKDDSTDDFKAEKGKKQNQHLNKFRTLSDDQIKFYLDAPYPEVKEAAKMVADERGLNVVSKEDYIKSFEDFTDKSMRESGEFYKEDGLSVRMYLMDNPNERRSLDDYVGMIMFKDLRDYHTDKIVNKEFGNELKKHSDNLSKFISNNKITKDLVLNRRVLTGGTFFTNLKEGDIYSDDSFSSTSLLEIQHFGDFNIKILAKKGSNVANADNIREQEYLVDKGSKFRVLERKDKGITVELL